MKYSYTSRLSNNPLKSKSDPPKESEVVTKPEDSTSDGSLRSRSGFRRFLERFKSNRRIMKNMEFYGFETIRATNGYMKSIQKRSKNWTIKEKERFIEELRERLETEESVFDFLLLFDGRIRVKRNYYKKKAEKKARVRTMRTGANATLN
jgi:hypothetical protein